MVGRAVIDFTIDTQIERSPEEVFDYVTDPDRLDTWQTNTVSAVREDQGPMRVGSRLREVHRAPGGKELPSLVEVTEFERPRAFGLKAVEGSLPVDLEITLEPRPQGTLMRFHGHGQPTGAARLAQPILQRVLKRQFAGQCATLKQVMEGSG
jgi:uncharacterized protein YndB with AHSA1/START domain